MSASANDLVIVLTGGNSNTSPNLSLGGDPSSQPLIGVLNNLFDNVSAAEAEAGRVDHRCVYIFNNNSNDTMYDMQYYIESEVAGGANIQTGISKKNEKQKITITGPVTGGSYEISYTPPGEEDPVVETVSFNADTATWAINLENAINAIPTLDVSVSAGGTFENWIFTITFTDYRSHDLLDLDVSGLTGTGTITGDITRTVVGAPVNSIPPELESETTPPNGINFTDALTAIGPLYPEEGFPLWIQRTVPEGTEAVAEDGFNIRITFVPIV